MADDYITKVRLDVAKVRGVACGMAAAGMQPTCMMVFDLLDTIGILLDKLEQAREELVP